MTSSGFAWEGLFRSLQGNIMMASGAIIVVLCAYLLVLWLIRHTTPLAEGQIARTWTNRITVIVLLGIVIGFGWRIASVVAINRMPRADVDRTAVYDQMQNNLKR